MMSIVELKDIAGDNVPAPENTYFDLGICQTKSLGLLEMEERVEHLTAAATQAKEELASLKKKAAKG